MPLILFPLLFAALELWLMIVIGGQIGALSVIGLLALGVVLGGWLIRRAGQGALQGAARALEESRDPSGPMLTGAATMLAGLLFIAPGFLSDSLAVLLLIPALRRGAYDLFAPRLRGNVHVSRYAERGHAPGGADAPIEADYVEIETPKPGPREE